MAEFSIAGAVKSAMMKLVRNFFVSIFKIARFAKILLVWLSGKAPRTNCPRIRNSVFIIENGTIYSCCGGVPERGIGNINRENLLKIWQKSWPLKILRLRIFLGCLNCYANCLYLERKEKKLTENVASPSDYPQVVHIQFGTICNFDCVMCWQDHVQSQSLDIKVLQNNIDWDRVDEVILQGGEVFVMPEAMKFHHWLIEEKKKKVNVITNGFFVDDEKAKLLIEQSQWVVVSVNAATKEVYQKITRRFCFDRVVENIKKLVAMKHFLHASSEVVFHFTCSVGNLHEIPDAVGFAARLGCDRISYGYDASIPAFLKNNIVLRNSIKTRLQDVLENGQFKIKFTETGFQELGLLDNAEKYAG